MFLTHKCFNQLIIFNGKLFVTHKCINHLTIVADPTSLTLTAFYLPKEGSILCLIWWLMMTCDCFHPMKSQHQSSSMSIKVFEARRCSAIWCRPPLLPWWEQCCHGSDDLFITSIGSIFLHQHHDSNQRSRSLQDTCFWFNWVWIWIFIRSGE